MSSILGTAEKTKQNKTKTCLGPVILLLRTVLKNYQEIEEKLTFSDGCPGGLISEGTEITEMPRQLQKDA
jgi:hypothetical protein